MKAKTFKDWLTESRYTEYNETPNRIICIIGQPLELGWLAGFQERLEETLKEMNADGLGLIHIQKNPEKIVVWIGYDHYAEWGAFRDSEIGNFDYDILHREFRKIGMQIEETRNDWQAVYRLIATWHDAPTEELMWLHSWCDKRGYDDLVEDIKNHPNWPEDPAEWAWGEW